MEFFTVWWYDLLLGLALAAEGAVFVLDRLSLSVARAAAVSAAVLLELSLVLGMLVLGGSLTDLLIVLMICALAAAGLAYLGMRRTRRADGEGKGVSAP